MIGEADARALIQAGLQASTASETLVIVESTGAWLTRFAGNQIHQNVAEHGVTATVQVAFGRRVGVASGQVRDAASLASVVARAEAVARVQQEDPAWPGMVASDAAGTVGGFVDATASWTPEDRSRAVAPACERAAAEGLTASGALRNRAHVLALGNSAGTFQYHAGTDYDMTVVVMGDDSSGYADRFGTDVRLLDPEEAGNEAIDAALRSRSPRALDPGEFTVVLSHYAVSDVLDYLAYLGFSGQAVQEGRSFLAGHFGERLLSPAVSIWDDGRDPSGIPSPFDYEGVPRTRTSLVDQGVAVGACYDRTVGGQAGVASTGHALPPGETFGPVPMNLFLAEGDSSLEAMIAGTTRGVLVTRFWYTRPVHPRDVVMTGMTRDGTWLIEHGEVVAPVRNLRFTTSYLDLLRNVTGISSRTWVERSMFSANRVPDLRADGFRFVSGTDGG